MNQCDALLSAFRAGIEITNDSAKEACGIRRLSGRIYDLRQKGYNIVDFWREGTNRFGHKSKWKVYRLVENG